MQFSYYPKSVWISDIQKKTMIYTG